MSIGNFEGIRKNISNSNPSNKNEIHGDIEKLDNQSGKIDKDPTTGKEWNGLTGEAKCSPKITNASYR